MIEAIRQMETEPVNSDICVKITINGKVGLADKETGEIIAEPIYEEMDVFSEGLIIARTQGEFRYLDEQGNIVIIIPFDNWTVEPFQNGIARRSYPGYNVIGPNDWCELVGFIDKTGAYVIPPIYSAASKVYNGETMFVWEKQEDGSTLIGVVNTKGEALIEPIFEALGGYIKTPSGDMTPIPAKKDGKCGFINDYGETVIDFLYDDVAEFYSFSDNITSVKQDGKYGIIDREGNMLIEPQYDRVVGIMDSEHIIVCPYFVEAKELEIVNRDLDVGINSNIVYELADTAAIVFNYQVINSNGGVVFSEDKLLLDLEGKMYSQLSFMANRNKILMFDGLDKLSTIPYSFENMVISNVGSFSHPKYVNASVNDDGKLYLTSQHQTEQVYDLDNKGIVITEHIIQEIVKNNTQQR